MILTGKSLGKRQHELNSKVNDAASKKVPFQDIKDGEEKSDIDKLFKIDLASKYKNVDYLINVLKSGDGLYVSRVLKCIWLYDDQYSNVINPDYLHHTIFPVMSTKMKKKLLTTVSTYVKNEARAADFYNYCINAHLHHFAFKFLIFTTVEFKENIIRNHYDTLKSLFDEPSGIKFLIGNSFILFDCYLEKVYDHKPAETLIHLRYFYKIDQERYLNTWETLWNTKSIYFISRNLGLDERLISAETNLSSKNLGLRISKDIMTNHKSRIIENVHLYLKLINISIFCKYTTCEEAKNYAAALLPDYAHAFWENDFPRFYSFLLDLIPSVEKLEFIKKIYTDKYPNEDFETRSEFYDQNYYDLMSVEEKEYWALRVLENPNMRKAYEEEREYVWYKFINYEKAIAEIKKLVLITPDASKRADIVNILIESARNQEELEKLFKYYYERHVNEDRSIKISFVRKVSEQHKVWEFNEECWEAFNKLLYSIELYNPVDHNFNSWITEPLIQLALIYNVLHETELPEGLKLYADSDISWYRLKDLLDKIVDEQKKEIIYEYLLQLYVDKIKNQLDNKQYDDKVKHEARSYVDFIKNLLSYFQFSEELPEIAAKFIKLDMEYFYPTPNENKKVNQSDMMRLLKQDASLTKVIISERYTFKLNIFLRKMRVYFSNDLAQVYLKYFSETLINKPDYKNIFNSVYGLFLLADETFITDFMVKHAPSDPKIKHGKTDRNYLYIQEGICRFACYSRPPVPLKHILMYIKGDYLRFCLPMFNMYLANLQPQACLQFVNSLLDTPVSIQKHGLRLAFKCFSVENLTNLVSNVWEKQKDLSLRMIIYTYLLNKMVQEDENSQADLFKLLLALTLQLNKDDHEDVMNVLTSSDLPVKWRGQFLETAWKVVKNFPDDKNNIERKIKILDNIMNDIILVDRSFVRQVINEYLNIAFIENHSLANGRTESLQYPTNFRHLCNIQLTLTATYIITHNDKESLKSCLDLVKHVSQLCIESWNDCNEHHEYFAQMLYHSFVYSIEDKYFGLNQTNRIEMNVIFENILQDLQNAVPIHEIYGLVWRLRLLIITNKVVVMGKPIKTCVQDKRSMVIEIAKLYALEVMELVKEYVNKNIFTLCLLENLSERVHHYAYICLSELSLSGDMSVFLASELVGYNLKETVLMATQIVPFGPISSFEKEQQSVIKSIRSFDNFEVQASMYRKIDWAGFFKIVD